VAAGLGGGRWSGQYQGRGAGGGGAGTVLAHPHQRGGSGARRHSEEKDGVETRKKNKVEENKVRSVGESKPSLLSNGSEI